MNHPQNWQLDNLFEGGSASPEFKDFLLNLSYLIFTLQESLKAPASLKQAVLNAQEIREKLNQAESFANCLVAQNVHDTKAELLQGEISELSAAAENAWIRLDEHLQLMDDEEFSCFVMDPELEPISFPLTERRKRCREKLPPAQETLINDLSIDGYHGWSQLYGSLIGQITIPIIEEGKEVRLSWGQAYNQLSNPDRTFRHQIFTSSNKVWKENDHLFAPILNRIAGFRLKLYEKRRWPVLKEPLESNRMSQATLDAMWSAISRNKSLFTDCLRHKAQMLGLKKLSWYDLEAPISTDPEQGRISYDEAADFIIRNFTLFSPKMGAFAHRAFQERWIEAEDRPGKRPGGFCTGLPIVKESRIFMTFSGTKESLFTLAHELGHAFHNEVVFGVPELARQFPLNLAETASTFAEMVVSEAAFKRETDPAKRKILLAGKLERTAVYLLNIHARFLFDCRFHEERKAGALSSQRLGALMMEAQKEAYQDSLEEYHPYFWASKMHFSSTWAPFYNFPYTFGYLFSLGLYLRSLEDKDFEGKYIALLMDTGRMTAEDLAKTHLGEDLTKETFWQKSIDYLKRDARHFLES